MWLLIALLLFNAGALAADDLDHDSVDDQLEEQLLDQFVPTLMISARECNGLPAEFRKGVKDPKAIDRNGTLYGQVFRNGEYYEIHYYHLWEKDCGSARHDLDTEHISVLVSSDASTALFWYAAAHEGTVCDASRGAKAADLNAEMRGATVWVSHGKHASYLTDSGWGVGCGGDTYEPGIAFQPAHVVNLGEVGAPLNGSVWTNSDRWTLQTKMEPDFSPARIERLSNSNDGGTIAMNDAVAPIKATVLGSHWGLKGFLIGNAKAGAHGGKAVLLAGKKAFGWMFRKKDGE